jgi:hypothetical protein
MNERGDADALFFVIFAFAVCFVGLTGIFSIQYAQLDGPHEDVKYLDRECAVDGDGSKLSCAFMPGGPGAFRSLTRWALMQCPPDLEKPCVLKNIVANARREG